MTSTNPRYYSSTLAQPALSGRRVTVVGIIIGLILMLVAARGASLQILENQQALRIGIYQQTNSDVLLAPRGLISDRTGTVLAVSNLAWDVRINPTRVNGTPIVTDTATLASALSGATGRPYATVKQEMDTIIATWTPTKTNVSTLVAAGLSPSETFRLTTTLTAVKRCCLNFESTWERDYPQGTLAASVLGYVNLVPTGLSGVEDFYDNVLRATPGKIKERGNDVIELQQARQGADLTLTIDANLQRFVERRLAQALKDYDASGGTIIVMETRTGAILSMASLPTYDPNVALGAAASRQGERRLRNQAVSDLYDPGSTMKAVTWAAAIDSGAASRKPEISPFRQLTGLAVGLSVTTFHRQNRQPIGGPEISRPQRQLKRSQRISDRHRYVQPFDVLSQPGQIVIMKFFMFSHICVLPNTLIQGFKSRIFGSPAAPAKPRFCSAHSARFQSTESGGGKP